MLAIAFTGLPRSGKDTAADYLVEKYCFKKLVMSDEIGEQLKKKGKPDTKMSRSKMGKRLRDRLGDDIVAKLAFERAKRNGFKKVVFAGARSPGEIEFFRKNIEKFSLVAIESDKAKRFERRAATDGQRMKSFLERDKWELQKFGLGEVVDAADYTIENNSTIDEFQKAIDELMQKI